MPEVPLHDAPRAPTRAWISPMARPACPWRRGQPRYASSRRAATCASRRPGHRRAAGSPGGRAAAAQPRPPQTGARRRRKRPDSMRTPADASAAAAAATARRRAAAPAQPDPAAAPGRQAKRLRPALLKWGVTALLVFGMGFGLWMLLGKPSLFGQAPSQPARRPPTSLSDPDDPRNHKADRLPSPNGL